MSRGLGRSCRIWFTRVFGHWVVHTAPATVPWAIRHRTKAVERYGVGEAGRPAVWRADHRAHRGGSWQGTEAPGPCSGGAAVFVVFAADGSVRIFTLDFGHGVASFRCGDPAVRDPTSNSASRALRHRGGWPGRCLVRERLAELASDRVVSTVALERVGVAWGWAAGRSPSAALTIARL